MRFVANSRWEADRASVSATQGRVSRGLDQAAGLGAEQQVGLEADAQKDLWGLDSNAKDRAQTAVPAPSNHVAIGA